MHIYDEQIAQHYAAYRPPLHQLIVNEVLTDQQFEVGLDIGCGTGYSTIALTNNCKKIFGIDCSQNMLDNTTKNPKISYLLGSGNDLPIHDTSIDLVTFAGVLSYIKVESAVIELKRVCRRNAFIFPYDFEVIIDDLMQLFSLATTNVDDSYDHTCNFSNQESMLTLKQGSHIVEFNVTEQQAAHILLSDKSRYDPLVKIFNSPNPFHQVVDKLKREQWPNMFRARIYYSLHEFQR